MSFVDSLQHNFGFKITTKYEKKVIFSYHFDQAFEEICNMQILMLKTWCALLVKLLTKINEILLKITDGRHILFYGVDRLITTKLAMTPYVLGGFEDYTP